MERDSGPVAAPKHSQQDAAVINSIISAKYPAGILFCLPGGETYTRARTGEHSLMALFTRFCGVFTLPLLRNAFLLGLIWWSCVLLGVLSGYLGLLSRSSP